MLRKASWVVAFIIIPFLLLGQDTNFRNASWGMTTSEVKATRTRYQFQKCELGNDDF